MTPIRFEVTFQTNNPGLAETLKLIASQHGPDRFELEGILYAWLAKHSFEMAAVLRSEHHSREMRRGR